MNRRVGARDIAADGDRIGGSHVLIGMTVKKRHQATAEELAALGSDMITITYAGS